MNITNACLIDITQNTGHTANSYRSYVEDSTSYKTDFATKEKTETSNESNRVSDRVREKSKESDREGDRRLLCFPSVGPKHPAKALIGKR